MTELTDTQLLTIVKNIVDQHGCQLVDIDLENHILNIDGPAEARAECALALQDVLG
jgi:hypothetical protein